MDKDKDGKITLSEFEAAGLTALPNFDELGAEGHHYDVESGAYQPLLHLLHFSYRISTRVLPPSRRCARHEGLRFQPTSHHLTPATIRAIP